MSACLLLLADTLADPVCTVSQSSLDPAGVQAQRIYELGWLYFGVTASIYVIVVALVLWAVFTRRSAVIAVPTVQPPERTERITGGVVTAAVIASVVLLFVLLVNDYLTGREMRNLQESEELAIQVTGHQWWWEVRYDDPLASNIFTTANEIHIPVGKTVRFDLLSHDVIHSFWVPNLHGKRDLIPGHPTRLYLRADAAGRFWGQCAE
jgi:cytochrome c oxidase subunit 2